MSRYNFMFLIVLAVLCTIGQNSAMAGDKKEPIKTTAKKLAEEAQKLGRTKMEDKYYGKTLHIEGTVELTSMNNVYLQTGVKNKEGKSLRVVLQFDNAAEVKKLQLTRGQAVVMEGTYSTLTIFGEPSLKKARLIEKK